MADLNDVLVLCSETEEKLCDETDFEKRRKIIQEHIGLMTRKLKFQIPDFSKDLEWMNTDSKLSFHDNLQGKIVVLDFFTYCCINCMHVLPDLEALEDKYKVTDGLVIIGVHSAKFANEKLSANILSAILRYNIRHPVVNDDNAVLWQSLMIQCWPTFVVVGPSGQYLYSFVGEGHKEHLLEFIDIALYYFKADINNRDLPLTLESARLPSTPLRFPGKITGSLNGKRLIITDTGHNRIIVAGLDGIVQYCIGGTERGFKDGSFLETRFNSPQGAVMLDDHTLFVADTENHAIRKIDLSSRIVSTVVGTGKQGQDKEGGNYGTEQEISSPWDVTIGGKNKEVLFIAMAGTHQIWAYFMSDYKWFRGREFKSGTCVKIAGSGNEENRNNSYPDKAAFAQPSGLALSTNEDVNAVYIADSESSSIRQMSLKDGAVKGLVGGERDPVNLFAYGDEDGIGVQAKLQHPLAVALVTENAGPLLIADSYNHKIKSVDLKSKMCTTVAGPANTMKSSDYVEINMDEPGGLWVDRRSENVYIADTNNHSIKIVNLQKKTSENLTIIFPKEITTDGELKTDETVLVNPSNTEDTLTTVQGCKVKVILCLEFPDGTHLTEDAPCSWSLNIKSEDDSDIFENKGEIIDEKEQVLTEAPVLDIYSKVKVYLKCRIMFCDKSNLCHMKMENLVKEIDLTRNSKGSLFEVKFTLAV